MDVLHYPVITLERRCPHTDPKLRAALEHLTLYTHLLLTSRAAAVFLYEAVTSVGIQKEFTAQLEQKVCTLCSIGPSTAQMACSLGWPSHHTASSYTQEGMVESLGSMDLTKGYLFFPRSSSARSLIEHSLTEKQIRFCAPDLYDTRLQCPLPIPDLTLFDQVVFTSPSTVHGFFRIFPSFPSHLRVHTIGPITKRTLDSYLTGYKSATLFSHP